MPRVKKEAAAEVPEQEEQAVVEEDERKPGQKYVTPTPVSRPSAAEGAEVVLQLLDQDAVGLPALAPCA